MVASLLAAPAHAVEPTEPAPDLSGTWIQLGSGEGARFSVERAGPGTYLVRWIEFSERYEPRECQDVEGAVAWRLRWSPSNTGGLGARDVLVDRATYHGEIVDGDLECPLEPTFEEVGSARYFDDAPLGDGRVADRLDGGLEVNLMSNVRAGSPVGDDGPAPDRTDPPGGSGQTGLAGSWEDADRGIRFTAEVESSYGPGEHYTFAYAADTVDGGCSFPAGTAWRRVSRSGDRYLSLPAWTSDCERMYDSDGWDELFVVDGTTLTTCPGGTGGPDPSSGHCLQLVRHGRQRVELTAWIAQASMVDPALPFDADGLPSHASDLAPTSLAGCLSEAEVISTVDGTGDAAVPAAGDGLATVWVEFDVGAGGRPEHVRAGATGATVRRRVVGFGPDGSSAECLQEVELDDVGHVVELPHALVLKIDTGLGLLPPSDIPGDSEALTRLGCAEDATTGCATTRMPGFRPIRAALEVRLGTDGSYKLRAASADFPSVGFRAGPVGGLTDVVVNDASCHDLLGVDGLFRITELARRQQLRGEAPAQAWPAATCAPGPTIADHVSGGGRVDWTYTVELLLAARWADGAGR